MTANDGFAVGKWDTCVTFVISMKSVSIRAMIRKADHIRALSVVSLKAADTKTGRDNGKVAI